LITSSRGLALPIRSYGEYSGLARALDLVGERWTLLLLRELVYLGPRRFRDLQHALPGMAPNLLSRRLRELEGAGLLTRAVLPQPAGVRVYAASERACRLEPALRELDRWGRDALGDPHRAEPIRPELPAIALRAAFRPTDAPGGVREVFELRVDDTVLQAVVDAGRMDLLHGARRIPDVVASTDATTLAAITAGRLDAGDALASGALHLEGEPAALGRFMRRLRVR